MDAGYLLAYATLFFIFILEDYVAFLTSVFLLIPMLDILFYVPMSVYKKGILDDILLWTWFPCMFYALWAHTRDALGILCTGVMFGQGINVAHELMHRSSSSVSENIAILILAFIGYGHWMVYHLRGHHRLVGLPADPATCPRHMSVYEFIPRSIIGGWRMAWDLDPDTCRSMIGLSGCIFFFSWSGGLLWRHLVCSIIGIFFLEIINYIEHYGVSRKQDESVKAHHSWDYDGGLVNYLLFKLPCHADHHLHAGKPFTELTIVDDSYRLPFGYPWMMLMSLFPGFYDSVVFPSQTMDDE